MISIAVVVTAVSIDLINVGTQESYNRYFHIFATKNRIMMENITSKVDGRVGSRQTNWTRLNQDISLRHVSKIQSTLKQCVEFSMTFG